MTQVTGWGTKISFTMVWQKIPNPKANQPNKKRNHSVQKKGQTFEYMRQHAHMRLRTNTFGAVMRIRHNMAMAIHTYFHEHGFFYFHTPLITASARRDSRGERSLFLPLEARPDSSGVSDM